MRGEKFKFKPSLMTVLEILQHIIRQNEVELCEVLKISNQWPLLLKAGECKISISRRKLVGCSMFQLDSPFL